MAAPRDLEDGVVILYTSGTTVRPKSAQLTHQNIGRNADTVGARLAMTTRFDHNEAVRTIREQQVALFIGVPTMYGAVLARLRLAVSGGSRLPVELLPRLETTFGCIILEGYDLSEASPAAYFNHPKRRASARPNRPPRPGVANCGSWP